MVKKEKAGEQLCPLVYLLLSWKNPLAAVFLADYETSWSPWRATQAAWIYFQSNRRRAEIFVWGASNLLHFLGIIVPFLLCYYTVKDILELKFSVLGTEISYYNEFTFIKGLCRELMHI